LKSFLHKRKRGVALLILLTSLLIPLPSFAHDAYFLQVLIDDHRFVYQGNVIEDNATWYQTESKHFERELGKFAGLKENVVPSTDPKWYDDEKNWKDSKKAKDEDIMVFTFQPKEVGGWFQQKNNATRDDVEKAYKIKETLIPGLNDALRILNDGKEFRSIESLMKRANELAKAIAGQTKTVNGYSVSTKGDKVYIKKVNQKGNQSQSYEFTYRVKKGYNNVKIDGKKPFENDTTYITWNQLIFQANYAYAKKGYTVKNSTEFTKPNAVEEMVAGMLENTFDQLRNFLGLYDINELVYNQGIRGSSAYAHGIMPNSWAEKAIAYHWLFQALAWSLITLAIVKNLVQRNLATINPAMKISLMESIQNLLITGFILANAIPLINMFMYLNERLVAVFGATIPNFGDNAGLNYYTNTIGGVIIQFFYLGVSIYLNFVYIMRAITIAILTAMAPLFIVSIAFGGRWKQLFNTWMREIVGNIFLQSFHAFMLSFFFAISTSSRGIEGMIVTLALIPLTEFFRTLVMGSGGGIAHSMGIKSMTQMGSLVGGAVALAKKKETSSGKTGTSGKTSYSYAQSSDTGMSNSIAGNSEKIQSNMRNMSQRQRLQSTKEALANRVIPPHIAENKDHPDYDRYMSTDGLQTEPEGKWQTIKDKVQGAWESGKGTLDKPVPKAIRGVGKAAVGGATMAVGLGTALALGSTKSELAEKGMKAVASGWNTVKSGVSDIASSVRSVLPENTMQYATTLPNGDIQVHRNGLAMRENGVLHATMSDENHAVYTYDLNKLSAEEAGVLNRAYEAFARNNPNELAHYKQHGIEAIYKKGNIMKVKYNQEGLNQMGIKSVQTVGGKGSAPRIIETKHNYQPIKTNKIPSIPDYVPSTSTGNSDTQNPNSK
jgi:hypothetical protein